MVVSVVMLARNPALQLWCKHVPSPQLVCYVWFYDYYWFFCSVAFGWWCLYLNPPWKEYLSAVRSSEKC